MIQTLTGGNCRHCAAVGVTTDHNIGDPEGGNGVLHGGGNTARLGAVRRDNISGVADHEQIAGFALSDQLRHQPTVGAGNKQRPRALLGGEIPKQRDALGKRLLLELQKTVNDRFHRAFSLSLGVEQRVSRALYKVKDSFIMKFIR